MSFWVLLQVLANLVFLVGIAVLWIKLHRPPKDDPRLSRGLQILQSKISVLEDLSDRTETQSNQLIAIMEQKIKELQAQIAKSESQIMKIEQSMGKSLEVAKIFQDKIPHQEIIERQNTVKYVKAARLAHQGASIEEIADQVDLSIGEIELIAKVNRERLQFSEEDLPAWVKEQVDEFEDEGVKPSLGSVLSADFILEKPTVLQREESRKVESQAATLSALGDAFRQATEPKDSVPAKVGNPQPSLVSRSDVQKGSLAAGAVSPGIKSQRSAQQPQRAKDNDLVKLGLREKVIGEPVVKKVVFPRIEVNNNLG